MTANLVVKPTSVHGSLRYYMKSLTLKLRAFVKAKTWFYSYEKSKTLFSRSWKNFSRTLFSF